MIRRNKRAFSLVELAIGLAVIGVLMLAISFSSGIRDNARVQSAAASVEALRTAAENYLAGGKLNYTGVDIAALKAARLLPNNFTGTKANPWGGDFVLGPNAANNTQFDISLSGLTKADADKLAVIYNNSASATSFDASKNIWSITF